METPHSAPEPFFRKQVEKYGQQLALMNKKIRQTATFRIISFLSTVLAVYFTAGHSLTVTGVVATVGFGVFGFFVFRHIRLFHRKNYTERVLEINENELRLLHLDTSRQPEGTEFLDIAHPFAADLDVFGKRSLFQLLDRCATSPGQQQLAHTLLFPEKQKERIVQRQQAIAELAGKPEWRQDFQALGGKRENDAGSMTELLPWAKSTKTIFDKPLFRFFLVINPLLGIADITLIGMGILPFSTFFLFLFLPFMVLAPLQKNINQTFSLWSKKTLLLQQYARLFEKLEQGGFRSEILRKALKTLSEGEFSAYSAVKKLSAISKAFDNRLNLLVGIILNVFFLWDLLQCIRLERWKKRYGGDLPLWFDTLAKVDGLCSLAGFAFQHPEGVYPEIREEGFIVHGNNLKHPFIHREKCVGNPVKIEGWGQFQVITGANMAGKSTYLRTVGVNLLLAMTGAPVLADRFVFTPVTLFTGIKTSDSLQDGESYFFAELKRLKEIIVRLEKGEKLFIILDEVLKGTNSKDKQTGSKALLRQFIRMNASGMIATHDLALGELVNEFPENVKNKRFEVEITGGQMQFDYRLKEGVSKNLNATFLMKKMGITL